MNNSARHGEVYVMPKKIKKNRYPTRAYYKTYNIIIDSGSKTYFFQQEPLFRTCGTVSWWEEVNIPLFTNLRPYELIEIPANGIEEFIEANVIHSTEEIKSVSISSNIDTVSCSSMTAIMKILKDTANHINYLLRKTTQEENFVLEYKKRPHLYYDEYNIKWDSTKTLFYEAIHKIESEQSKTILDFEEAHLVKKRSLDEVNRLSAQVCDSALYQKLADRLGLKVSALFDFEL